MRVAGEARYRLASLALPDLDDLAEAARAEAVALFADRARHADAHFTFDDQTAPAVARLVTRLDGMPLAIELAAAQVEALGVTGLRDRLDGRLALLASGDRLAPPRQRSLAATVAWSYQLLDETERQVFRAVSVFPANLGSTSCWIARNAHVSCRAESKSRRRPLDSLPSPTISFCAAGRSKRVVRKSLSSPSAHSEV